MFAGKRRDFLVIILICVLSYPLLYHSYKFGNPDFGRIDFYQYYKLFCCWDFDSVPSPFNTRILGSFFVYIFYKLGLHYFAEINFQDPNYDQAVYFNAILVSWLSTVGTTYMIFKTIKLKFQNTIFAFGLGILYLFGFGTVFFEISSLNDSLGVLLFAISFYFYTKQSPWVFIPLLLSVIQREYVLLAFGLVALIGFLFEAKDKKGYHIKVLLSTIAFFGLYFLLRKTIFFTPEHASQINPAGYLNALMNSRFPLGEYIRQSFLIQNLLFIYLGIIIYKLYKKQPFSKKGILLVFSLLAQVVIISFIAVLGNSTGRYYYITSPLLLFYIALELNSYKEKYLKQIPDG